jgi:hypothetical protein
VTLVLTYAEIPYDKIYDREVMQGKLAQYDWLHSIMKTSPDSMVSFTNPSACNPGIVRISDCRKN